MSATLVSRTHLENGVVMLSEAKHLYLFLLVDRSKFDLRFFARLRLTFRDGF